MADGMVDRTRGSSMIFQRGLFQQVGALTRIYFEPLVEILRAMPEDSPHLFSIP